MAAISSKEDPQRIQSRLSDTLRGWLKIRELNIFSVLLLAGILISIFSPHFLTTNNLMGVFRSFSLIAIMSSRKSMVLPSLSTAR